MDATGEIRGDPHMASWSKRLSRARFNLKYSAGMFRLPKDVKGPSADMSSLAWIWGVLALVVHNGGSHAFHHLTEGGLQGF